MFPAKDIMTRNVITVHESTPVYKVIGILVNNKISGLPVVDDEGQLVGVISEKDMLELMMGKNVGPEKKASDYMTKKVISFAPDSSAVDICELFMQKPIRRVPIVEHGRVVGVISRRDILTLLLKIRSKAK